MRVDLDPPASQDRVVAATFGCRPIENDPAWQWEFAKHLKESYSPAELLDFYSRYRNAEGPFETMLRSLLFRAMCRRCGHNLQVGPGVVVKHPETFEIGDGVVIGAQTMIQGRYDGVCRIGDRVWIGPQSYFDARNLVIEDFVGWGPGGKVLGSTHTGEPRDVPIIATPLIIKPVVIGAGVDVGTNATVLPGVHIGAHSIIGAGAVVTNDIPEYAIAAGVPARVLRLRGASEDITTAVDS